MDGQTDKRSGRLANKKLSCQNGQTKASQTDDARTDNLVLEILALVRHKEKKERPTEGLNEEKVGHRDVPHRNLAIFMLQYDVHLRFGLDFDEEV